MTRRSRRRFLQLSATGLTLALAGCGLPGGEDEEGGGEDGGGGGEGGGGEGGGEGGEDGGGEGGGGGYSRERSPDLTFGPDA